MDGGFSGAPDANGDEDALEAVQTVSLAEREGLGRRWQLVLFFLVFLAIVSRRPDALSHPQFFGEEGPVWFANAYNWGWLSSLLLPQNGYFQTLPRLAASLALLVPLHFAPLVMNLVGITIQALPVNVLLSSRCAGWGSLAVRGLFGLAYIALPNSGELNVSVGQGQWHLALLACILVLSAPALNLGWRIFDISIFLLSGLTGPFCILLLPVALVFWWMRREIRRIVPIVTLAIPAIIQLLALYHTAAATREKVGLGASLSTLVRLVSGQVYLGAFMGETSLATRGSMVLLALVALCGAGIMIYCFLHAELELKLFLLFAGAVFGASLANPMVSNDRPQWQILELSGGIRYWFFPTLAFAWALIWCATRSRSREWRWTTRGLLAILCVGVVANWQFPAYPSHHFKEWTKRFAAAPAGSFFIIPIVPEGWVLKLSKKPPDCSKLPVGELDAPQENALVSGQLSIAGWVSAPKHIDRVSIYMDKVLAGAFAPNVHRPDVDAANPNSPDRDKGWGMVADTSRLNAGKHEIEVRAREVDGCEAAIARSSFELVPGKPR